MISRRKCMQQLAGAAAVSLLGERLVAAGEPKSYSDPRWPDFEFSVPPVLIYNCEPERKFCREAVVRRMADGSLYCLVYTGGPREPHDENLMLGTRSTDDGQAWSTPEVIFKHPKRGVYAPELWVEDGPPSVFLQTLHAESRYLETRVYRSISNDQGLTWGEPCSLPGVDGCFLARRGILLADGTWLFPVYWTEQRGNHNWTWEKRRPNGDVAMSNWIERCGVIRSTDHGATFSLHGYLHAQCQLLEPACIELEPGHILMLMRAERQGRFYRSESHDGGRTWSAAEPSDIAAVASKVVLLKHGDAVVMLFNPPPEGAVGDGLNQRRQLAAWVSRDGCRTWATKHTFARVVSRPDQPSWRAVCYPDGFIDARQQQLYVTVDTYRQQFLLRIPLGALLPA
jgi:predicted neuraminidase